MEILKTVSKPGVSVSITVRDKKPGAVNSGCPTSVSKYATFLYLHTRQCKLIRKNKIKSNTKIYEHYTNI